MSKFTVKTKHTIINKNDQEYVLLRALPTGMSGMLIGVDVFRCSIKDSYISNVIPYTIVLSKNEFFGMYLVYDNEKDFTNNNLDKLKSLLITIDKDFLYTDDLVMMLNNVNDIDLMILGYNRVQLLLILKILSNVYKIPTDFGDTTTKIVNSLQPVKYMRI